LRSVAEYLQRAAEFEALAAAATIDVLSKRYSDITACYRLLARERRVGWISDSVIHHFAGRTADYAIANPPHGPEAVCS
jgi:hypothetical protein